MVIHEEEIVKYVVEMDLINDVGAELTQERLDELDKLGIKLSPGQIERIKYEAIGRGLTQKKDVLHAESGAIVTTDFFDALLVTTASELSTRDLFIINPDIQPLYNINNDYMGFFYYGKIRNLKNEKRNSKIKRSILSIIATVSMFAIGFNASLFIIMLCIVVLVSFGYMSLMIGMGEGR